MPDKKASNSRGIEILEQLLSASKKSEKDPFREDSKTKTSQGNAEDDGSKRDE